MSATSAKHLRKKIAQSLDEGVKLTLDQHRLVIEQLVAANNSLAHRVAILERAADAHKPA